MGCFRQASIKSFIFHSAPHSTLLSARSKLHPAARITPPHTRAGVHFTKATFNLSPSSKSLQLASLTPNQITQHPDTSVQIPCTAVSHTPTSCQPQVLQFTHKNLHSPHFKHLNLNPSTRELYNHNLRSTLPATLPGMAARKWN